MSLQGHYEEEHSGHHVTPYKILYGVFGALITLTIATVITAAIDLGGFNVPLALAIATGKATLVVMFFMALKYDTRVNILVFSIGLIFVGIFLGFTLLDTEFRDAFDAELAIPISDQESSLVEQQGRSDALPAAAPATAPAEIPDSPDKPEAPNAQASQESGSGQ